MLNARLPHADESWDLGRTDGSRHSYLIATTQRSGSHYLAHLLAATGQLGCPFEYFHPGMLADFERRLETDDPNSTLAEIRRLRTSPSGWFGMKAHWPQFECARSEWKLDEAYLSFDRFILIERRDRIAQAVSLAIAQQTKSWLSVMPAKPGELHYKPMEILGHLERIEAEYRCWRLYFAERGITPFRIVYEDLVADPLATLNALLLSFGAEPVPGLPPISIQRQATQVNQDWRRRYARDRLIRPNIALRHVAKALKRRLGR